MARMAKINARVISKMTKDPVNGAMSARPSKTPATATALVRLVMMPAHSRPKRPVGRTARISAIGA
jgi:hypothetical protein